MEHILRRENPDTGRIRNRSPTTTTLKLVERNELYKMKYLSRYVLKRSVVAVGGPLFPKSYIVAAINSIISLLFPLPHLLSARRGCRRALNSVTKIEIAQTLFLGGGIP